MELGQPALNSNSVRLVSLGKVIEGLLITLRGIGFTRFRFYRHYGALMSLCGTDRLERHGISALCYKNDNIKGKLIKGELAERVTNGKQIRRPYSFDVESDVVFNKPVYSIIEAKKGDGVWDDIVLPSGIKEYSFLELSIFTDDPQIIQTNGSLLLVKLVFDKYDVNNKKFPPIDAQEIKEINGSLVEFCKSIAILFENRIRKNIEQRILKNAKLDDIFIQNPDNPDRITEKLLQIAVEVVGARVGYLIEEMDGYYRLLVRHGFDEEIGLLCFSKEAINLPAVRCWQTKTIVSIPNLKKYKMLDQMKVAYRDPRLSFLPYGQTPTNDQREAWVNYIEKKVGSILCLPVQLGPEMIACFSLHSGSAYHFDQEKIDNLQRLLTHAVWILTTAKKNREKELLVEGLIHEIRTDIQPLGPTIDKLKPAQKRLMPSWHNAQLCVERLRMTSSNLLTLARPQSQNQRNYGHKKTCKNQFEILKSLTNIHTDDLKDRQLKIVIKNENDAIWKYTIITSVEWFTHVAINLLDNAVKYCRSGQSIHVKAKMRQSKKIKNAFWLIEIRNHGQLDEETIRTATIPYYRSKHESGFHIGLASCNQVLQRIGGGFSIKNDSKNDQIVATAWWKISE